ncbi:hypothetical protein K402DRAFT_364105 [Aulographum hederae CBS 113979]|uniref:Amino acid transporter transmembrane domain-containing protein n=1 Tax=Aulographum hederae CBS 113979 TaxID=1176131 RepID=A0A6G1GLW7_9PEZI|nr:hypothetical protein K402DRAFT_364105 [Aulographum hederae CBS 113979]
MNISGRQPTTWEDYEHGGQAGSPGSQDSRVRWDDRQGSQDESSHLLPPGEHNENLRRRRSSMSMRINSIRRAGGVNSIDNFARSWQRAAGFYEITPVRKSFRVEGSENGEDEDDDEDGEYARHDVEASPQDQRSLLRSALENEGRRTSEHAIQETHPEDHTNGIAEPSLDPIEESPQDREERIPVSSTPRSYRDSIFQIEPSLASPFGGSYGTTYGSLASRVNRPSMQHAGKLFTEQQMKGTSVPDKEREPLLVRQVEDQDGVKYSVVVGQSTLPQTVFNSVNVLVGVGLLSLPLGIRYSGWLIGMVFFLFSVIATQYTAKLLAKCLDVDNSLITFADLAFVSFGSKARIGTSILFSLELIGANVALIILFADSLDALIPGWGVLAWKLVCGVVLIPLAFLPLRFLSFTSIAGIMCCFGIVLAVIIDGIIKPEQPGSLHQPANTYLFPMHWGTVPLALGLLMSPWGGHSVFPNIYRDMRHPYKYRKGVNITYIFTYLLDLCMAVIGYTMFGDDTRDEITSNIFLTKGYPKGLSVFIVICIAIIPLTKVPLNARPIVSTVEVLCGLDSRALSNSSSMIGMSGLKRGILKIVIRVLTIALFAVIAIVFPSFDRIMTLMGSVCCFTVCLILPVGFHLKLFGGELTKTEYWSNWALLVVSSIMAIISTVFACLPKELVMTL